MSAGIGKANGTREINVTLGIGEMNGQRVAKAGDASHHPVRPRLRLVWSAPVRIDIDAAAGLPGGSPGRPGSARDRQSAADRSAQRAAAKPSPAVRPEIPAQHAQAAQPAPAAKQTRVAASYAPAAAQPLAPSLAPATRAAPAKHAAPATRALPAGRPVPAPRPAPAARQAPAARPAPATRRASDTRTAEANKLGSVTRRTPVAPSVHTTRSAPLTQPTPASRPAGAPRHQPTRLRLTRRGRVVLATFTMLATAATVTLIWMATAGGAAASSPGTPARSPYAGMTQIVVRPGQTLWSVAVAAEPSANTWVVVQQIMDVNSLTATNIQAGQLLWVPKD